MKLRVDGKPAFAATGGAPFRKGQPCVVFVHGAGMYHIVWALQARYFAYHGNSVLAIDLPGHGASKGPALTSIEAMGAWLLRVLDAKGVDQAILVGHSMGALVALEAAAQAPKRVEKLALLGGAGEIPVSPALLELADSGDPKAFDLMALWGHHLGAQIGGHPSPGLWMMGGSIRLLERGAEGLLAADLGACAAYKNGSRAAAKVRCPVLLVIGGRDVMTPPRAGRALGKNFRDAAIETIPDSGHLMIIEQPDATLDTLRKFIA